MNKLKTLTLLVSGSVATILMAVGLNEAAQKVDPVSQKSLPISTMETGDIASMPCAPCTGGDYPPPPPPPGGGGFTDGSDRQFHA
jgi:hypothetical protein